MKKKILMWLIFALVAISAVQAYTVTIQPGPTNSKDTWISSANESGYNQTKLNSGRYWTSLRQEYWTFIQFDYSNLNITNSTNVTATLQLYYYYGGSPRDQIIYATNGTWSPNTLTWNNRPGVGQYYSNETLVSGSWYSWDVTQHVKSVKLNSMTNNGFIIKNPSDTDYDYYYSSRYAGNVTLIPRLVVTIN